MSLLIAPRPPQWRRMHEEEDRQGSLFGGETFRPPPPRRPVPPRDDVVAPRDFAAPPEAGEIRVSRGATAPLAGPTLDDVVTHAWEGLGAGVPAACPVCHGEIEPVLGGALRGHCGNCGVTLD